MVRAGGNCLGSCPFVFMENPLSVAGCQLPVSRCQLSEASCQLSGPNIRKVFKTGALLSELSPMDGILYGAACKVFKTRELQCSLTPLNRILCNFSLVSCCTARLYFFYFFIFSNEGIL